MLDEVFAEAIVHKPTPWWVRLRSARSSLVTSHSSLSSWSGHVILGLRVRPFSFWHQFNLDLIGFTLGSSATPSRHSSRVTRHFQSTSFNTLLLAARCCRLRYPQTLATPSVTERLLYELASLRFAFKFAKSSSVRARETKKFVDYRKDYADCAPEMADAGAPIKLPGYAYQVALLRRLRPELTKAQAWDYPIAEAQWEILCVLAAQGAKIDIVTPEDRRDFAEMDAEQSAKITPLPNSSPVTRHSSLSANG